MKNVGACGEMVDRKSPKLARLHIANIIQQHSVTGRWISRTLIGQV